jgi:DNA-binding MarR family transcriptional regulator
VSWQRKVRAALAPHELTHAQFALLTSLWWLEENDGPPSQARLAEQAATDQMMTSQVLRRLEGRGLVSRSPDPGDARAQRVATTAAGRKLLAPALADVEAVDAEYFAPLGGRREAFLRDLARLS